MPRTGQTDQSFIKEKMKKIKAAEKRGDPKVAQRHAVELWDYLGYYD